MSLTAFLLRPPISLYSPRQRSANDSPIIPRTTTVAPRRAMQPARINTSSRSGLPRDPEYWTAQDLSTYARKHYGLVRDAPLLQFLSGKHMTPISLWYLETEEEGLSRLTNADDVLQEQLVDLAQHIRPVVTPTTPRRMHVKRLLEVFSLLPSTPTPRTSTPEPVPQVPEEVVPTVVDDWELDEPPSGNPGEHEHWLAEAELQNLNAGEGHRPSPSVGGALGLDTSGGHVEPDPFKPATETTTTVQGEESVAAENLVDVGASDVPIVQAQSDSAAEAMEARDGEDLAENVLFSEDEGEPTDPSHTVPIHDEPGFEDGGDSTEPPLTETSHTEDAQIIIPDTKTSQAELPLPAEAPHIEDASSGDVSTAVPQTEALASQSTTQQPFAPFSTPPGQTQASFGDAWSTNAPTDENVERAPAIPVSSESDLVETVTAGVPSETVAVDTHANGPDDEQRPQDGRPSKESFTPEQTVIDVEVAGDHASASHSEEPSEPAPSLTLSPVYTAVADSSSELVPESQPAALVDLEDGGDDAGMSQSQTETQEPVTQDVSDPTEETTTASPTPTQDSVPSTEPTTAETPQDEPNVAVKAQTATDESPGSQDTLSEATPDADAEDPQSSDSIAGQPAASPPVVSFVPDPSDTIKQPPTTLPPASPGQSDDTPRESASAPASADQQQSQDQEEPDRSEPRRAFGAPPSFPSTTSTSTSTTTATPSSIGAWGKPLRSPTTSFGAGSRAASQFSVGFSFSQATRGPQRAPSPPSAEDMQGEQASRGEGTGDVHASVGEHEGAKSEQTSAGDGEENVQTQDVSTGPPALLVQVAPLDGGGESERDTTLAAPGRDSTSPVLTQDAYPPPLSAVEADVADAMHSSVHELDGTQSAPLEATLAGSEVGPLGDDHGETDEALDDSVLVSPIPPEAPVGDQADENGKRVVAADLVSDWQHVQHGGGDAETAPGEGGTKTPQAPSGGSVTPAVIEGGEEQDEGDEEGGEDDENADGGSEGGDKPAGNNGGGGGSGKSKRKKKSGSAKKKGKKRG